MERPLAFTFLGSLNLRDRITDYTFMTFSRSLNSYEKEAIEAFLLFFQD